MNKKLQKCDTFCLFFLVKLRKDGFPFVIVLCPS